MSRPMAQSNHMQPLKQSDHKKSPQLNNQLQAQTSRPKWDTNPQSSLIYKYFNVYLVYMDIMVFTNVVK